MAKTLVILSGGADSATLAYHLRAEGRELHALSFDYGQRHRRELAAAATVAAAVNIPHRVIELPGLGALLKGSALTDGDVAVPHGHYAAETMRLTVVPNRNTIMLSIAWGVACAGDFEALAYGAHAGDHHIYPDCRPGYVRALEEALRLGTEGHRQDGLRLLAPFIDWSKADIIRRGIELAVPYEQTWTCYEGGALACGLCGSCRERLEAFDRAGTKDPLAYAAIAA